MEGSATDGVVHVDASSPVCACGCIRHQYPLTYEHQLEALVCSAVYHYQHSCEHNGLMPRRVYRPERKSNKWSVTGMDAFRGTASCCVGYPDIDIQRLNAVYLATYLLTYLLHGAESFLSS